jgi:hypothetical protein
VDDVPLADPDQEQTVTDPDTDPIEYAGGWTAWDWLRWSIPWLLIGLCLGAGITAIIDGLMP